MPRQLTARPLTAAAYARFGRVLAVPDDGASALRPAVSANQGSAEKHERLVALENLRPATAAANVSIFRCRPRAPWPFPIALLEKHPASTQLFIPMAARRYVVLVAGGTPDGSAPGLPDLPNLDDLHAFVATGRQAISYAPGTWHHPLIALDEETDFVCLVHEDGTPQDCVEHPIAPERRPVLLHP